MILVYSYLDVKGSLPYKVDQKTGSRPGDFPRYAWCKIGDTVYEARLVNRAIGEYKGWQLKLHEWPDGIDDFDWNT